MCLGIKYLHEICDPQKIMYSYMKRSKKNIA